MQEDAAIVVSEVIKRGLALFPYDESDQTLPDCNINYTHPSAWDWQVVQR